MSGDQRSSGSMANESLADELARTTAEARAKQARKTAEAEAARREQREAAVGAEAREFVAERTRTLEAVLRQAAENGRSRYEVWKHIQHQPHATAKDEGIHRGMVTVASWLTERGFTAVVDDTGWEEDDGYSGRRLTLTATWNIARGPEA